MMTIRRRDHAKNEARFHALTIQGMLDSRWSVVHEWGRIGSPGTVRAEPYPDEAAAHTAAKTYITLKRRRGYG
jgi:predicted DNA-binding WGR domain protein